MTRAPATILVVDDHPTNTKLVAFVLARRGFEVRAAGNADEALAELARARPDLILMDLQLPGTDGLTLTRRLRADPAYRDLPIVALTAYAMASDEQSARAAGCDAFVAKPIDTRALADLVARLLTERAG